MNRADITDLWCTVTVHCGKRQHSHQFHFFKHVAKSILQLLSRDLVSRLPALGIRTVEVSGSTVCHGGTSPAPCFQFTFAAFLEFIIISVFFHLADPDVCQPVFPDIRHPAVGDSAARHDIPVGRNGNMAVAAVTTSVDHAVACILRQLKLACLVFVQRPQVVFSIK